MASQLSRIELPRIKGQGFSINWHGWCTNCGGFMFQEDTVVIFEGSKAVITDILFGTRYGFFKDIYRLTEDLKCAFCGNEVSTIIGKRGYFPALKYPIDFTLS